MTYQVPLLTPKNYLVCAIKVNLIIDAYEIRETVQPKAVVGRKSWNVIDRQSYDCQDMRVMNKQDGVNIMAVKVQIKWLWMWSGRGREFWKSRDGNERVQRDVMLHVSSVFNNQMGGKRDKDCIPRPCPRNFPIPSPPTPKFLTSPPTPQLPNSWISPAPAPAPG